MDSMNTRKTKAIILGSWALATSLLAMPSDAAAKTFKEIVSFVLTNIFEKTLVPLLISLSVVSFLYGVFKYIKKGSEVAVQEGKSMVVYGLFGLAAVLSVWGLVRIVTSTFLITDVQIIDQDIRSTEGFEFFRNGV